jgi:DNA-binding CsgD family transcriptional regulator
MSVRPKTIRLSNREIEVLRLVAAGHKSQSAADVLFVSKRTVDFHLENVFYKLGATNRMQAVRAAWALGLLPYELPQVTHRRC